MPTPRSTTASSTRQTLAEVEAKQSKTMAKIAELEKAKARRTKRKLDASEPESNIAPSAKRLNKVSTSMLNNFTGSSLVHGFVGGEALKGAGGEQKDPSADKVGTKLRAQAPADGMLDGSARSER